MATIGYKILAAISKGCGHVPVEDFIQEVPEELGGGYGSFIGLKNDGLITFEAKGRTVHWTELAPDSEGGGVIGSGKTTFKKPRDLKPFCEMLVARSIAATKRSAKRADNATT
jgi:hypothetical protein